MVTPNKRENPVIATCYACLAHLRDVSLRRDSIASFASSLLPASSSSSSPPSLPSLPSSPGESWSQEPLHPIPARRTPGEISDWIFTVSLLNFSFWSELQEDERYAVRWKNGVDGKGASGERDWTGYWSLPAAINRALEDGMPITTPSYWLSATDEEIRHVFRATSGRKEGMPLLDERIRLLREAGKILVEDWQGSFHNLFLSLQAQNFDALALVEKVVATFPQFQDQSEYPGVGTVYLWKRPQILIAELWAAFSSCPAFPQITNISALTMFADYRVPQILHDLGLIAYSAALHEHLSSKRMMENGEQLEVEIRIASICAVEEIRKEYVRLRKEGGLEDQEDEERVNAVTIDFWLWNRAKDLERQGVTKVECHRTRSIWY